MRTPDVIRTHRVRLRLTQAELAREILVDTRQINRYETGETEPTLAVARRLVERLGISMDELAGETAPLNGIWISAWHNLGSDAKILTGTVELTQEGHQLSAQPPRTTPQTSHEPELTWSGVFYVDRDSLLGGYKIETPRWSDGGLMNLNQRDGTLDGVWTRIALKGARKGRLCLAREPDTAVQRLKQLLDGTSLGLSDERWI